MSLPSGVRTHQTVWIDVPGGRTAAVRYEMDGDRLVCFGDDSLSGLVAGTQVTAGVRGLADGPLEAMFWVHVRDLDPEDVRWRSSPTSSGTGRWAAPSRRSSAKRLWKVEKRREEVRSQKKRS